ncbi:hypothetical protein QQ045_002722 [Rhodiola kirilowii]
MSMCLLDVQGIHYKERISSISLEGRQIASQEEKRIITGSQASAETVNYEGATMKEEMMMVVMRRRRRRMSSRVTSKKKPQEHHHHHWMPSIHEDYYGPRHHKPTHH